MPAITVRFYAGAAAATGTKEQSLDALTVDSALATLRAQHGPELTRVLAASSLLLDGTAVSAPQTRLADGMTLDVLPPFAGG